MAAASGCRAGAATPNSGRDDHARPGGPEHAGSGNRHWRSSPCRCRCCRSPSRPLPSTRPRTNSTTGWPSLTDDIPVRLDPYVIQPPSLDFEPNHYRIAARLDPQTNVITGTQTVEFTNMGTEPWPEVWFHLYPNAFAVEAGAPTFVSKDREYPRGFNPAYLRVEADTPVEIVSDANGKDTLLRATLTQPLAPGARGALALRFVAKLPEAQSRFSHWDDVYSAGNWYPVLAMFDKGEWRRDPYYALGDPFFTPVAQYEVSLHLPKDFLVGSTGIEQSRVDADGDLVAT